MLKLLLPSVPLVAIFTVFMMAMLGEVTARFLIDLVQGAGASDESGMSFLGFIIGALVGLGLAGQMFDALRRAGKQSKFGKVYPGYDGRTLPVYNLVSGPDELIVRSGRIYSLGLAEDCLFPIEHLDTSHRRRELSRQTGGALMRMADRSPASIRKTEIVDVAAVPLDDSAIQAAADEAAGDIGNRAEAAVVRLLAGRRTEVIPYAAFVAIQAIDAVWAFAIPTDVSDEVMKDLTGTLESRGDEGNALLRSIMWRARYKAKEGVEDAIAEFAGLEELEELGDDIAGVMRLFRVRTKSVDGARGRMTAELIAGLIRDAAGLPEDTPDQGAGAGETTDD